LVEMVEHTSDADSSRFAKEIEWAWEGLRMKVKDALKVSFIVSEMGKQTTFTVFG